MPQVPLVTVYVLHLLAFGVLHLYGRLQHPVQLPLQDPPRPLPGLGLVVAASPLKFRGPGGKLEAICLGEDLPRLL
ncbi:MAG: hypothetical protein DRQ14_06220, partial [Candidatus Latescibacterota bacterium]